MNPFSQANSPSYSQAFVLGITAALLFFLLAGRNIEGQGIYSDELHQATEAFPLMENQPAMFTALKIKGIPALNMTYSGAIKTNIYRIYLSISGQKFSIKSWRLLGIFFISLGIFSFSLIAGTKLPLSSSIIFLSFIILDCTVLLSGRHDYGPVALALCLRLMLLAFWISGELSERIGPSNTFVLGAITGFSIFEKLSSVVLLGPLFIIIAMSPRRQKLNHLFSLLFGGIIGGLPLIVVNVYTYLHSGDLISLNGVGVSPHYDFTKYIYQFISMGTGDLLKEFIFGIPVSYPMHVELFLSSAILSLTTYYTWRKQSNNTYTGSAKTLLLGYFSLIILIYCLPKLTYIHHWLIGTPFHYLAISLTCAGIFNNKQSGKKKHIDHLTITLLIALFILRGFSVFSLEKSFITGESSSDWDPAFAKIGYFASQQPADTVFLVADWGISPQIFCLSNGRPDFVYELYKYYEQTDHILKNIKKNNKKTIYLVTKKTRYRSIYKTAAPFILARMKENTEWQETSIEAELSKLHVLDVKKFIQPQ